MALRLLLVCALALVVAKPVEVLPQPPLSPSLATGHRLELASLATVVQELQAQVRQLSAASAQLHANNTELRAENTELRLRLEAVERSQKRSRGTPSAPIQAGARRALASSCSNMPETAQLFVDGVCNCVDDVRVGNRSVSLELNAATHQLSMLNATVEELSRDMVNLTNRNTSCAAAPSIKVTTYIGSGNSGSRAMAVHAFCVPVNQNEIAPGGSSSGYCSCEITDNTLEWNCWSTSTKCSAFCFDI